MAQFEIGMCRPFFGTSLETPPPPIEIGWILAPIGKINYSGVWTTDGIWTADYVWYA